MFSKDKVAWIKRIKHIGPSLRNKAKMMSKGENNSAANSNVLIMSAFARSSANDKIYSNTFMHMYAIVSVYQIKNYTRQRTKNDKSGKA